MSTAAPTICTASPCRPNVVVFLSDDQGYADVGYHGSDILTPHIDAIAYSGVRFGHAYVSSPVCSPSRAGLLTGRYQDRFGYRQLPSLDPTDRLAGIPLEEETLGELLQRAGYKTYYVVSPPRHAPIYHLCHELGTRSSARASPTPRPA
jgi:arylsulfatase A-like enzyme